jgi:virginiamycin B lyase
MWFTEWGKAKIGRITMKGEISELAVPHAGRELTVGADGNFWYTSGKCIGRLTPRGEVTEFPIPSGETNSIGIALGLDRNLYFCEFSQNKIGKITPEGKITEIPLPTEKSEPFCLTNGPDGNIWIALQANRIARLTVPGSSTIAKTAQKGNVTK